MSEAKHNPAFAYKADECEHNFSSPGVGLEDLICPHCGTPTRLIPEHYWRSRIDEITRKNESEELDRLKKENRIHAEQLARLIGIIEQLALAT